MHNHVEDHITVVNGILKIPITSIKIAKRHRSSAIVTASISRVSKKAYDTLNRPPRVAIVDMKGIAMYIYQLLLLVTGIDGFIQQPARSHRSSDRTIGCRPHAPKISNKLYHSSDGETASKEDDSSILPVLLKLASAHFSSQALHTATRLGIPDIIGEDALSLDEISQNLGERCNKDALLRTLRLLTTIDVVKETASASFSLTRLGMQLRSSSQTTPNVASVVQHWMEKPLWDAWLELPDYIVNNNGDDDPFARANGGISSDFWYNEKDHPESLQHANNFVRLIHHEEIDAVLNGFDWSVGKKLVDIGGHHGQLVGAIADQEPTLDCYCLDLPNVISKAPKRNNVTFYAGDVMDPSTIPTGCDIVLLKHFLDRCMWTEEQTVEILQNCHGALDPTGTLVIAEAVLPAHGQVSENGDLSLQMDALYMLVGRESQRTETDWQALASKSSFEIQEIKKTNVPSCSLIILKKQ